jgi:hypothetical protein
MVDMRACIREKTQCGLASTPPFLHPTNHACMEVSKYRQIIPIKANRNTVLQTLRRKAQLRNIQGKNRKKEGKRVADPHKLYVRRLKLPKPKLATILDADWDIVEHRRCLRRSMSVAFSRFFPFKDGMSLNLFFLRAREGHACTLRLRWISCSVYSANSRCKAICSDCWIMVSILGTF